MHAKLPPDLPLPATATELDPYRRGIWGESKLERDNGQILVLESKVDGHQLRLWLYTTQTFQPYAAVDLDTDDAAQLVIFEGSADQTHASEIIYLSNHVDVEISLGETLEQCTFSISPHDPEIDRGRVKTRRLRGTALLHFDVPQDRDQPLKDAQLPITAYSPEVVRGVEYSDKVPPGYQLRTRPEPKLLRPGIGLLAGGYGASLTLAGIYRFQNGGQLYTIPIVGPALYIPTALRFLNESRCEPNEPCESSLGDLLVPVFFAVTTVGFTAIQTAGLSLVIAGLVKRDPYWTKTEAHAPSGSSLSRVTAVPWFGPGLGGLRVQGAF